MKVITELIHHFWKQGQLTPREAEFLVRQGFARERDLPGFELPPEQEEAEIPDLADTWVADVEVVVALDPLEQAEEALVRRTERRKQGAGKSKARGARIDQLRRRTRIELDCRRGALAALCDLVDGDDYDGSWQTATARLRDLAAGEFRAAITAALRSGALSLRDLWQATDLDPFRKLLDGKEPSGSSERGFCAVLAARDTAALGAAAWLLKYEEMQALRNLRTIRERVLQILCAAYRGNRQELNRWIKRGATEDATWALVLLHNAHRFELHRADASADYGPIPLPDSEVWNRAEAAALEMDRPKLTKLLAACYQGAPEGKRIGLELYCPKGWHVTGVA